MREPGFWIEEDIFTYAECDLFLEALSRIGAGRSRAGVRNLMAVAAIKAIAEDERLLQLGERITGRTLMPYKATLFEKTSKANWLVAFHQDTALPIEKDRNVDGWGPSSKKEGVIFSHAPTWALSQILALRIHVDSSTSFNGPLRVIPGSHKTRIQDDKEFNDLLKPVNEIECLVGKGGVISMSPLIIHASSKSQNNDPRRVLHIEYAISLDLGSGVRLAIA